MRRHTLLVIVLVASASFAVIAQASAAHETNAVDLILQPGDYAHFPVAHEFPHAIASRKAEYLFNLPTSIRGLRSVATASYRRTSSPRNGMYVYLFVFDTPAHAHTAFPFLTQRSGVSGGQSKLAGVDIGSESRGFFSAFQQDDSVHYTLAWRYKTVLAYIASDGQPAQAWQLRDAITLGRVQQLRIRKALG